MRYISENWSEDNTFSTRQISYTTNDSEKHRSAARKVVGPLDPLTSILKNVDALHKVVESFMEKVRDFAGHNVASDFGEWLEM